MENYIEYLIKKKFGPRDMAKYVLILVVLFGVVGAISISPLGWPSGLVVLAFGGYGSWWLASGLRKEFEYIMTNDHLDVDMITAGRSRKRVASFDMEAVELCARIDDPDRKGEMNRDFSRTVQAASSPDAKNARFVVYSGEKGLELLIFEPNDKIVDAMSMYAKSKVFK